MLLELLKLLTRHSNFSPVETYKPDHPQMDKRDGTQGNHHNPQGPPEETPNPQDDMATRHTVLDWFFAERSSHGTAQSGGTRAEHRTETVMGNTDMAHSHGWMGANGAGRHGGDAGPHPQSNRDSDHNGTTSNGAYGRDSNRKGEGATVAAGKRNNQKAEASHEDPKAPKANATKKPKVDGSSDVDTGETTPHRTADGRSHGGAHGAGDVAPPGRGENGNMRPELSQLSDFQRRMIMLSGGSSEQPKAWNFKQQEVGIRTREGERNAKITSFEIK